MISVIIPALNEEKHLPALLEDIRKQKKRDGSKLAAEVIVADADSDDATRKIAKRYGCKIVKGGLPAKARNNGAKHAKGKYLFFFDADIRLKNDYFISSCVKQIEKRNLDLGMPWNSIQWEGNETLFQKVLLKFFYTTTNMICFASQHTKYPKIIGTCIIIRKNVFKSVNGFSTEFYWGEDVDLAERVKRSGYKLGRLRRLNIYMSPRKPSSHGIWRYFIDSIKIEKRRYRQHRFTKKDYKNITGKNDYFKK